MGQTTLCESTSMVTKLWTQREAVFSTAEERSRGWADCYASTCAICMMHTKYVTSLNRGFQQATRKFVSDAFSRVSLDFRKPRDESCPSKQISDQGDQCRMLSRSHPGPELKTLNHDLECDHTNMGMSLTQQAWLSWSRFSGTCWSPCIMHGAIL